MLQVEQLKEMGLLTEDEFEERVLEKYGVKDYSERKVGIQQEIQW